MDKRLVVVDRSALDRRLTMYTDGLPMRVTEWLSWSIAGAVRDGQMPFLPVDGPERHSKVVVLRTLVAPREDDLFRETVRYVCEYFKLVEIVAPQNVDLLVRMPFFSVATFARNHLKKVAGTDQQTA